MKIFLKDNLKWWLLPVLCCWSLLAAAQHSIEVKAPSVFNMAEGNFKVEFRINSLQVEQLSLASSPDFEVYSGPVKSVYSSTVSINGKRTSEEATIVTYILAPNKVGKLKLATFTAVVGGKKLQSPTTEINVMKDNGSQPSAGTSGAVPSASQGVSVKATASRKKVYEQQGVFLKYKYYAVPQVQLVGAGVQQKPDFKGVMSQDVPLKGIFVDIERINNQPVVTGTVMQMMVFPQQTGKVVIPGVTFNFDVEQRRISEDPFDAFFNGALSTVSSINRTSNDVELEVMPLPQPQPALFSGAVGQFTVKGEMLTKEFRTNDVATFRLTIEGSGNLKLMAAPTLQLPKDFDVYSPKVTDETKVTEQGVTGRMVYDYTFVPRVVDRYTLEPMTFVYFDPDKEEYRTARTESYAIEVLQGTRSGEDYARSEELRRSDIREFRKSDTALTPVGEAFWWGGWLYWTSAVLMVLSAMLVFILLNKYQATHADAGLRRSKKAGMVAVARLKGAKTYLDRNDRSAFYAEVTKALFDYVADKFGLQLADLSRSNIEAECLAHGVSAEVVQQFLHILDECEFARYAPSDQVMPMQQLYDEGVAVIIAIENK